MAEVLDIQPLEQPPPLDVQPVQTAPVSSEQLDIQPIEGAGAGALDIAPLPTVSAKTTGYWPANTPMEGGPLDRMGAPLHTIEAYRRGEVPWAGLAGDPSIPYGTPAASPAYPDVPFRIVDTGDRFKGVGLTHFDIAHDNEAGANSTESNQSAVPFQVDINPDLAGKMPTNIPGDPLADKGKTSALLAFGLGAARAIPGVAAGAGLAASLEGPNIAISAFTGPAAPVTMAGLNILEFLGGMLIGNRVSKEGEKALAPHSELIRNAQAAAADHPLAEMVGEQVPMAPFVLRSAKGFYDVAKSADTASAAARSIAKGLTGGAAGGVATEAARPHVEQALNFAGQQLGLTPEQIQEPTVRSYLENAAIGAALAGEAARQGAGDKGIGDVKVPMRADVGPVSSPGEVAASTTQAPIEPITSPGQETRPTMVAEPAAPAHLPDVTDAELLPMLQRAMARAQEREAQVAPAEAPATVRLYHGGAGDQAGSDFTPSISYARGYAEKSGDLGKVFYVDVPADAPFLRRDEGADNRLINRQTLPDEIANQAKILLPSALLKLRADRNEAGFLNPELLQGAADFGRQIYRRGMDFAQWAAEMIQALGRKIRPHLAALWNSITGQNILPHARESGAVGRGNISQESIEGAANKPDKQREHIKTIQRMTEVSPTVKEQVESWYSPSSIPEVNARAQARIDEQSLDAVLLGLMKRELTSNDDLALAHAAALRLDGMGRIDDAITVREKMAESLTGPAQMLQYISTISKTSPEGLVREAQKTVTNFIAQDPEKQKLLGDIQRLQQQLAAATAGQTPEAVKATINLTLRDLAKVNKPGQRLTPERLNDLIKRNDAGVLTADELARALMRHLNIPQVTPENISRIKAAQKLYAQAEANGDSIMRLRRGMEMMDQVYGLVPRSFWDKVRATATISMILHGKLPFRIGFSNAVRLIGQTMVDTIENVPRDLGNVFTGKRTITVDQLAGIGRGLAEPYFTFRSGYEDAKLRGLTTGRSFVEGTKTLIDIAGMTTRGIMDLTDIRGRNSHTFSSRFGQMAENVVTLIHNIVPYAFWNAGYRSSLARQMRVAGVETPTAEMVGLARVDANKAIFQNETVAYHALFGVRKILDADINYLSRGRVKNFTKMQAKYGLGTATIPFAKVPAALLTEGANWTPLGLVRALGETARPLFGHELRPKEIADNVIKAAIGTGSAFMAGMWLSKLGVLSGPMDDDKNMKAMMQSLGWGAYKLNLSELKRRMASGDWTSPSTIPQPGDLIVNYNWAEPIAFPVAMGAHITEAQNAEKRAGVRGRLTSGELVTSIGAGAEALLDNPMLQSVQQLSTNLGEGNYGKLFTDIVGNVPGNFIPSLVRQTAQYMDNTVREARGGSMVDGEVARIVQQIPGLSQRFPARYDVFGEAVKRQNYGQVSLINTFFNPAQVSRFKANPEVSELMRLWIATGSSAGAPRGVDKSLTITKVNGQKQQIQLDNQQLATYQRYVGRLSAAMVTRLMASPAYAAAPDVVRQNTLTQVLEAVQRSAKIDLFGDRPFRVNMGSLTSKPSVSLPSFMDIGALAGGRKQGLTQPVGVGGN